jgi:hypothetical protein
LPATHIAAVYVLTVWSLLSVLQVLRPQEAQLEPTRESFTTASTTVGCCAGAKAVANTNVSACQQQMQHVL